MKIIYPAPHTPHHHHHHRRRCRQNEKLFYIKCYPLIFRCHFRFEGKIFRRVHLRSYEHSYIESPTHHLSFLHTHTYINRFHTHTHKYTYRVSKLLRAQLTANKLSSNWMCTSWKGKDKLSEK